MVKAWANMTPEEQRAKVDYQAQRLARMTTAEKAAYNLYQRNYQKKYRKGKGAWAGKPLATKQKVIEQAQTWAHANPDRRREISRNSAKKRRTESEDVRMSRAAFERKRRAAKWGVEENFTPYQRGRIRKQFGRKCFRCGKSKRLCLDHNLPLCAGNALAYGNAVVLCRSCNAKKGTKLPTEFYTAAELRRLEPYLAEQRTWSAK